MPKLISPDPPSFNPSSISSFSTSNGSKRPISICKKKMIDNNFKNLDKFNTRDNKNNKTIKTTKLNEINETKLKHIYTYSTSSSYSSMSSSLNLEMSSSSSSANTEAAAAVAAEALSSVTTSSSSSMYSSLNEKSINQISHETNKYIKMVDRKFIGVLPRLSGDSSLAFSSKKSLSSKLESTSEVSTKKNGWKIKEKYKKSSKRNSLLKLDDIIERNHPALLENLKCFNYISASAVSSSSSASSSSSSSASSFLSISDAAAIQKPFSNNNIKSVALSYYHHLYEQKQKSINSNNLQPLYKFTYNKNNSNFKTARLSTYETLTNNESSNNSLFTRYTNNNKIKKDASILNDTSLSRLEKNLPDCLIRNTTTSNKTNGLNLDRLTKSTNNLDNEMIKSNLKIISKLNRNEFLDDKLNVKTIYKNISNTNKRKHYSDPHNSIIRDTLDKLDDTRRKNWLTTKNNLTLNSQLEINVCNINSKSQAFKDNFLINKTNLLNKPLQLSINTQQTSGGLLTADIKLNDQTINFDLNKIDETRYEIKLLPTKTGIYQVNVYLNQVPVSGSPFLIKIENSAKNETKNIQLRSKETISLVDMKKYDRDTSPINFKLMVRAELIEEEICLNVGKEIKLNIIAIDTAKKQKLMSAIVGIQSKIMYNNLEPVKHNLETDLEGNYQLKFMPTKEGIYDIKFYKDEIFIEGSSLELIVREPIFHSNEKKPMHTQVGIPFIMTVEHKDVKNLKVKVNMKQHDSSFLTSSSSFVSVSSQSTQFSPLLLFMSSLRVEKFIENSTKLKIKFVPVEPVEHTIDITENGKSLENYPIKLNVYPNKEVLMINENSNGVKIGSSAKLSLRLNDQKSSLNIKITHLEENTSHFVSFLLTEEYLEIQHILAALCKFLRLNSNRLKDGECSIENGQTRVKFLLVDDTDQNSNIFLLRELKTIIDNEKYVIIDLSIQKTIKAVKDSLKFGPKNENVRFKLEKRSDELYNIEFKPILVGKYRVDIENFKKPILNSPCFIDVYDSNKVVIEKAFETFLVGTENFIDVDLSKAGSSKFKVWIETPFGANQPIIFDANNKKKIGILPKEAGKHLIFMKLGDSLIKGIPLEITAAKPDMPVAYGHGLYRAIENQKAVFNILAPDNFDSDLNIKIKNPTQKHVGFTIAKISENDYQITYFPNECGKYLVSIEWKDQNLPKSIYEVCVFNPAKIKVLNYKNESIKSKILNLDMNEENLVLFDTREAGSGILTVEIYSANYEKIPYSKIVKDRIHKIFFTPPSEGEYRINAMWNSFAITRSAIMCRTKDYSSILNDISFIGDGLSKPKLNEQSEFIIDASKVKNLLEFQPKINIISSADGDQENIDINTIKLSQNVYKCNYLLERPDDYLMNVKINDLHVASSPFQFNVCVETDPSKVKLNKDDIKMGIIGQEIKTLIDTSQAGPGELTANCMGSHKPAICKFEDKKNGIYLLTIIAQEVGKHVLQIKYNDEHIPDSPFNIRVSNQPDASKVKVFGPGIYHGILNDFKSKFSCDTKGAGAGQLTVRIKGPKGAFKVEMQRENEKDRKITCKYDPIEAGEYQINVKWSGKHVPNSPFNVRIFKRQEELDTFFQENPNEKRQVYNHKMIENE